MTGNSQDSILLLKPQNHIWSGKNPNSAYVENWKRCCWSTSLVNAISWWCLLTWRQLASLKGGIKHLPLHFPFQVLSTVKINWLGPKNQENVKNLRDCGWGMVMNKEKKSVIIPVLYSRAVTSPLGRGRGGLSSKSVAKCYFLTSHIRWGIS